MTDRHQSPFMRALGAVEHFSEKDIAVMPEKPPTEMLRYIAQLTGEDADKLARIYAYFISIGRLDGYGHDTIADHGGFAEE